MPKSKHRKNQKQKSKARTAKITAQQTAFKKELENKKMDIEEVKDKP